MQEQTKRKEKQIEEIEKSKDDSTCIFKVMKDVR